jgi:hypothetical protein
VAAHDELPRVFAYDAWVVNDDVSKAADEVASFIDGRGVGECDPVLVRRLIADINLLLAQGS